MATGTVKWFNNAKGFGFIRPDTGGDDIFVHFSYIQMEGYRSLRAGQQVSFDLHTATTGFHAINLTVTGEPAGRTGGEHAHGHREADGNRIDRHQTRWQA